jgi:hypothetical protein
LFLNSQVYLTLSSSFTLIPGGLWRYCERMESKTAEELCWWAEVGPVHRNQVMMALMPVWPYYK